MSMQLISWFRRFIISVSLGVTLLLTSATALAVLAFHPHSHANFFATTNSIDKQLASSKIFQLGFQKKNHATNKWWKKIILDRYKPINSFDNAVIQAQKYNYTIDPTKQNPSISPGYGNVNYNQYSLDNPIYPNSALYDIGYSRESDPNHDMNITPQNSFSKNYYFNANSGAVNDFSWYSADPTIVNKHQQPNLSPPLNSEYNGYFAGSRSLLFGMNFGLPSSLEYSLKTLSSTGLNPSVSDLNYQYSFSLPSLFADQKTFSASGSSSGSLPTNSHYDQIKDPAKKIADPNKSDFAYYQLWKSLTNHFNNSRHQIVASWPQEKITDKGSAGNLKKPGTFFDYSKLPFNTNPNPKNKGTKLSSHYGKGNKNDFVPIANPVYNPTMLQGNFIGDPPTVILLGGRKITYIQANLLSYPFYVVDEADNTVYLLHTYVFYDATVSSSRIITFYSQFNAKKVAGSTDSRQQLSLVKRGILNDLLFNDYKSVFDKDIKQLNHAYKFCENMLPFFAGNNNYIKHEIPNSKPKEYTYTLKTNFEKSDFNQRWINYIKTGAFSFDDDGQTKLTFAPDKTPIPKTITEYPKSRESYIVDVSANQPHQNLYANSDLLNYNKNIYKDNFGRSILENKVQYTQSVCIKDNSSYKFPPLTPQNWILYRFMLTNGASEYFDPDNKDVPSQLYAYNPYRYYTALVGCHTDKTFTNVSKNSSYPNPFFSHIFLTSPSVGTNITSTTANAATLNFGTTQLAEFSNSGKTIDKVDKLNKIYGDAKRIQLESWMVVLIIIVIILMSTFLLYYYYRRKKIRIWRAKKLIYQKIGPQTQKDIAVDDIIHMINDINVTSSPQVTGELTTTTDSSATATSQTNLSNKEIIVDKINPKLPSTPN